MEAHRVTLLGGEEAPHACADAEGCLLAPQQRPRERLPALFCRVQPRLELLHRDLSSEPSSIQHSPFRTVHRPHLASFKLCLASMWTRRVRLVRGVGRGVSDQYGGRGGGGAGPCRARVACPGGQGEARGSASPYGRRDATCPISTGGRDAARPDSTGEGGGGGGPCARAPPRLRRARQCPCPTRVRPRRPRRPPRRHYHPHCRRRRPAPLPPLVNGVSD